MNHLEAAQHAAAKYANTGHKRHWRAGILHALIAIAQLLQAHHPSSLIRSGAPIR